MAAYRPLKYMVYTTLHNIKCLLIFFLILLTACLSGCSLLFPDRHQEELATELVSEGVSAYRNGRYRKAIEHFEKLKDWYPFDQYAILAELKIADAHYQLQEYNEAVFAYEKFESLHPKNDAIPYVIHQIGLCFFEQIDSIDRDQTHARKAASVFQRLIDQFPGNNYAVQARQKLKACFKSIAGHELYVGIFYYQSKHYKAALNRLNELVANYPDVGRHQKALEYIALCEASLAEMEAEN
jgi:outer membrane protein assembly factor BamD